MTETILTVLAVSISAIALFLTIAACYVWFLFHYQMKEIRKERELESQNGEGN